MIAPWVSLGLHKSSCDRAPGKQEPPLCWDLAPTAYMVDGLAQAVGVLPLTVGLLDTTPVPVRDQVARQTVRPTFFVAPHGSGRPLPA